MLQTIIDSKAKARLLEKMLERQEASFSISGLGRLADVSKASVSNIISEWGKAGLVLSRHEGRNKMVYINAKYYLLPELKKIFAKTKDFQKPLIKALESMVSLKSKQVKAVVVFGSRARKDFNHYSDFDVLIVIENNESNASERIVEEAVKSSGKTGIRFSPLIMGKKDFQTRLKEKDKFLQNILGEGKVIKGGRWIEHAQTAF